MSTLLRYLQAEIMKDLSQKMVFLGRPRQVGKTTFAKAILSHFQELTYLNWDYSEDRDLLVKGQLLSHASFEST